MKAFQVKEVKPNIFLFSFKDYYDMGMHFLRYSEFYESPFSKIRSKSFTILDFMEIYSKKSGNYTFTYPRDWGGYNFPGKIIKEVRQKGIQDPNFYDKEMLKGYSQALTKSNGNDFYIIGAIGKGTTLNHEIAHGYYYLDKNYKKEMNKLTAALPKKVRTDMNKWLASIGYASKVFKDETQAYFSTGLPENLLKYKKYSVSFKSLYKKMP